MQVSLHQCSAAQTCWWEGPTVGRLGARVEGLQGGDWKVPSSCPAPETGSLQRGHVRTCSVVQTQLCRR